MNNNNIIKILEWNINGRTGSHYSIADDMPLWIATEIIKRDPDVIILTELYTEYKNWSLIKKFLIEYGYHLETTCNSDQSNNDICIGLKSCRFSVEDVFYKKPYAPKEYKKENIDKLFPDNLSVACTDKVNNNTIFISGVRNHPGKGDEDDNKAKKIWNRKLSKMNHSQKSKRK